MLKKTPRTATERYVATLQRALDLAGGEHELAAVLNTPPQMLRKWLCGRGQPPSNKYIAALRFVTAVEGKR